jgi:hypothetical protein
MCSTEHMPTYRVEFTPATLRYRDAIVVLETLCEPADKSWIWRAVKQGSVESVVLLRRPTLIEFSRDRYEGFTVESGSLADKIMQRLLREGAAEEVEPGTVRPRRSRK